MKKIMVCVCMLSLVALAAQSQDDKNKVKAKPDLNGSWVLDKSRSNFGRFSQTPFAKSEITMKIALNDPEFHLTRNLKTEGKEAQPVDWVYYTDGRGETNPPFMGRDPMKSKTKWDGSKLVAKSSTTRQANGYDVKLDIEEKWELSKDGKNLIDTLTFSTTEGFSEVKLVYNRAP